MTKRNLKNYSIGLDIGSTSVGWSVVDHDYNILKYKNKNMWGARLFDEGKTAVDRRISRASRRRLHRRKERIALLKSCMGRIVINKDKNFFMRMERSCLTTEDKKFDYNLFNDVNYNDVNYYEDFKTIYHLRKYLCETEEKADPRFIYLALHHIVKYRGNFLYEGQNLDISNSKQIQDNLMNVILVIFQASDDILEEAESLSEKMIHMMTNAHLKKSIKKDQLIELFVEVDKDAKKQITEIANLLLGYESNLSKLFPDSAIQKDEKDYKTNFSSTKYEEDLDFIEISLQEHFEQLSMLYSVYSFIILQDILSGHVMLSDAMIAKYNKHHEDLSKLKACIRKTGDSELYRKVFRNKKEKGNYFGYINEARTTSKVELYAFLKKTLSTRKDICDTELCKEILDEIEKDNFLPRQNSKDNGVIPYQMHEKELVKILELQGRHYPILQENADKIISLFKFRVPYYVGPINTKSTFAWISRNEDVKITPWNFEEEVNLIESAENFIRKMTNCCSYLLTEPVVPKKSLLYAHYEVLNELNKIRVQGKLMDTEIKKMILDEVFMTKIKVTKKDIQKFYVRKQLCSPEEELDIRGFQKENEFASSLEPWIKFKTIYGADFVSSKEEIEKLIEWISVYEDKKILKKRIEKEYPYLYKNTTRLNQILKLRFSGWGRLSKELLVGLRVMDKLGNYISIMDCLESTQMNFMQIINDKDLNFKTEIEKFNQQDECYTTIRYEQVANLQGSPAIKKGIWQTVQIVNEIVEIMGHQPENVYIEFAREDNEKKRIDSRLKKLQEIYTLQSKEHYKDHDYLDSFQELKKYDKEKRLDNDRLVLYFIQQGKCMYSGKSLDISKLHLYQIDHILPQSYIKDDSIENKVLVISAENQYKGNNLLISKDVINRQYDWWKYLLDHNLMGEKKFKNLTKSIITEKEEIGFINRQLVETRQITKHVANLFKCIYQDTNIVSIKATLSSEFRKKFELYKVREINDYHHAQDAYLACVIGTFVMRKYDSLRKEFIFTEYNQISNYGQELKAMQTTKSKYGFILNSMGDKASINSKTGEVIWEGTKTIEKIRKTFSYKDCYITKKAEERKGQLFNLTISKNCDLETTIKNSPHKVISVNRQRSDVLKYGGFTSLEKAYGIAVEYKVKNKVKREMLDVPRILANASNDKLIDFLKQETKADEIKIIKSKILFNQLFEVDGGRYTMASSSEWNNAKQLILSSSSVKTVYMLFDEKSPNPSDDEVIVVYDEYIEKVSKHFPMMKGTCEKLREKRMKFLTSTNKHKILKELFKATKAGALRGTLTDEDFKFSAIGRISGKVMDLQKTQFIFQSITGMFEQKHKF